MTDIQEVLRHLVVDKDISSIEVLSSQTCLPKTKVIALLEQMVKNGVVKGHFSDDKSRFFREDIQIMRPVYPTSDTVDLSTEKHNTSIFWKVFALLGFGILIVAFVLRNFAVGDPTLAMYVDGFFFVGLVLLLCGCYQIGKRPTL